MQQCRGATQGPLAMKTTQPGSHADDVGNTDCLSKAGRSLQGAAAHASPHGAVVAKSRSLQSFLRLEPRQVRRQQQPKRRSRNSLRRRRRRGRRSCPLTLSSVPGRSRLRVVLGAGPLAAPAKGHAAASSRGRMKNER